MAYVARDTEGNIIGVSKKSNPKMPEFVPDDSPELQDALRDAKPQLLKKELDKIDKDLGRLAEDILQILIKKNVILFTDLPVETQDLIYARNKVYKEWMEALQRIKNNQESRGKDAHNTSVADQ